jgi:hypothetical protein
MPLPNATHDELESVISDCENNTDRLSSWERDTFLPSIRDQFDRLGTLTQRQQEVLERMYIKLP